MILIDKIKTDKDQMQIFFTAWKEFQVNDKRYLQYFEFKGYLYIDTETTLTEYDLKLLIQKYIKENL